MSIVCRGKAGGDKVGPTSPMLAFLSLLCSQPPPRQATMMRWCACICVIIQLCSLIPRLTPTFLYIIMWVFVYACRCICIHVSVCVCVCMFVSVCASVHVSVSVLYVRARLLCTPLQCSKNNILHACMAREQNLIIMSIIIQNVMYIKCTHQ